MEMDITSKYEKIGKRWTKNGMDRIYINIDPEIEYDERDIYHWLNRHERQNYKVYWDCQKSELVITGVYHDDAKDAIIAIVNMMINK